MQRTGSHFYFLQVFMDYLPIIIFSFGHKCKEFFFLNEFKRGLENSIYSIGSVFPRRLTNYMGLDAVSVT